MDDRLRDGVCTRRIDRIPDLNDATTTPQRKALTELRLARDFGGCVRG